MADNNKIDTTTPPADVFKELEVKAAAVVPAPKQGPHDPDAYGTDVKPLRSGEKLVHGDGGKVYRKRAGTRKGSYRMVRVN